MTEEKKAELVEVLVAYVGPTHAKTIADVVDEFLTNSDDDTVE